MLIYVPFPEYLKKQVAILLLLLPMVAFAHGDHPEKGGLLFEENKRQYPSSVQFMADIPGGRLFVEKGQLRYAYHNPDELKYIHDVLGHEKNLSSSEIDAQTVHFHSVFVNFLGNSAEQEFTTGEKENYSRNYFKGSSPSGWSGGVSVYRTVGIRGLYPGIDLSLYSSGPHLKYDLYVAAGADPSVIRMQYEGADDLKLKDDGILYMKTSVNEVMELAPVAYQTISGAKIPVNCRYRLDGNVLSFEFPDGYNTAYTLVIDPVLVASTYSGSNATTYGHSATYDDQGNIYAGGRCFGAGYPTTPGAYDGTFGGSVDVSISKYSPNGTTLLYATYLGGTNDDYVHSMIVNTAGELYIMGSTSSADYPTTAGTLQPAIGGGYDIIISRLNPAGNTLLSSTYLGGTATDGQNMIAQNYGDGYRGEIDLDGSGNILIANFSSSTNFPVTPGAFDGSHNGAQDGVVCKLNSSLTGLLFSTFIGGSGDDATYEVSETSLGDLLICGGTASNNFPVTAGAYQTTYQGGTHDGWVGRISANGSSLVASTYYGTAGYEQVFFSDIDNMDNIYVYGQADNVPAITPGTYSQPGGTMFLAMLNTPCSSVTWSTGIGPAAGQTPTAFLVDQCRKIYMAGWDGTAGLPVSPGAIQSTTDGSDFYLLVLAQDADSLLYATYMGDGSSWEHVDGGTSRFDKQGIVYEAVCEGGTSFPTTPGAYSNTSTVGWDIVVFKIDFEQQGVIARASAAPSIVGCAPFTVNFNNTSLNAQAYFWDFDDGTATSTLFQPSHTFQNPGTYQVMLVATDSTTCNISDTTYITIQVGAGDSVEASFDYVLASCSTYNLIADNTSFGAQDFLWIFGDGDSSDVENPTHSYSTPGPWTVTLIATDTVCIGADTIQVQIQFGPPVLPVADFTYLQSPDCEEITVTFTNNSQNAGAYFWDFGDGNSSYAENPTHVFDNPGDYLITFIATDTLCNQKDTMQMTITVDGGIAIDLGPDGEICPDQAVNFDAGSGAESYLWSTGDTTQAITVTASGTYIVEAVKGNCVSRDTITLYALTFDPAPDTNLVCPGALTLHAGNGNSFLWSTGATTESITVLEETTVWYEKWVGYCLVKDTIVVQHRYRSPDVYIPNTFTPNNDGLNEAFHIVGADKEDYELMIFNRWGEMLFYSNSPSEGWNGRYMDSQQIVPQGTYVWKVHYVNYCQDPYDQTRIGHINVIR